MAETRDPYETLGLERGCSPEDVRRAYRREASRWHPDRDGGDRARFDDVCWANETLSDPARRAAHDSGQPYLDESPESVRRDALTKFLSVTVEALTTVDDPGRALEAARDSVERTLDAVKSACRQVDAASSRLDRAASSIQFTPGSDGSEDPLKTSLAMKQREASLARRKFQRDQAMLLEVLVLLSKYDVSPPSQSAYDAPYTSAPKFPWSIQS